MGTSKNDHIAVIGGGAFGLSTAYELSQQGYTNITVFEKDADIPSRWSAANDLNKIMRAEYEDPWYTELGVVSVAVVTLLIQSLPTIYRKPQRNGKLPSMRPTSTASAISTAFPALAHKRLLTR